VYEATPWSDIAEHMERSWRQGEHVCMIGPTGCGKTSVTNDLIENRRYVVAFAVKREDETLESLGWPITRVWPPNRPYGKGTNLERFVLWPKIENETDFQNQHNQFNRALWDMFGQGRWTIYADDLKYMSGVLKLDKPIRAIAEQGRSAKLTLVSCVQRPSRVPVEVYTEVGHLFIWRPGDGRDQKRLMEIAGAGPIDVREMLDRSKNLSQHGVLYVDVHTGVMLETILDDTPSMATG
jgi:hypothetical protein